MFGRISFGRSSGGSSSSSNSGGSGVSAGGGREIWIRCGRGSYETRNHYWSEKAQACVDIYASSASKYPSGTGSSSREGRGDGGSGSYLSGTGGIGNGGSGSTFRTTQESSKPMIKYISLALGAPQKSLDSICKIQVNGTEYHAIDYGAKSRLGIMKYGTISYSNLLLENTLGKIGWRPDFHKIKFISLKGCSLLDADLLYFNDNLVNRGYLPNLLELDLSENYNLSSAGILHLLKTPKCIINLNLGSNNIDQYGLIYIASALTQGTLPSLNSLNLSSNTITDGGLAYLLENAVVPSLKTLDLSGNQITNLGLAYFYRLNSFKTAKYLVNLNLSGNNIDDWGAKYIEEGFMHNKLPHLNSLSLANNNITDTGAKYLADSLQKGKMSKLKTLHLEGNKFSPDGEGYLVKGMKVAPNNDLKITFVEAGTRLLGKTEAIWKTATKFSLNKFLEHAEKRGIDTSHIATNKSTLDYILDISKITGKLVFGVAKCSSVLLEILSFDTTAPSIAKGITLDMYGTKAMKKVDLRVCVTMEIHESIVSSEGVDLAVKAIDLLGDD